MTGSLMNTTLFIILFTVLYTSVVVSCKHRTMKNNKIAYLLLFLYCLIIFSITIFPLPEHFYLKQSFVLKQINWYPFRDVIFGYRHAKREILLNIMLFIPFGYFLTAAINRRLLIILLITFTCSLIIESMEVMTILLESTYKRHPDITDIITNCTGALVGYLFFQWFTFLKRHIYVYF